MKIKRIINALNSNQYSEIDSKEQFDGIMHQIPEKYLMWSNEQSDLLSSLTGLDLNDWQYKI